MVQQAQILSSAESPKQVFNQEVMPVAKTLVFPLPDGIAMERSALISVLFQSVKYMYTSSQKYSKTY